MKSNVGMADKILRVGLAIVLVALNLLGIVSGTISIVFWVIAAVLVLTSLVSFCPLYGLLGTSTYPRK
jgi:hypothetical protein